MFCCIARRDIFTVHASYASKYIRTCWRVYIYWAKSSNIRYIYTRQRSSVVAAADLEYKAYTSCSRKPGDRAMAVLVVSMSRTCAAAIREYKPDLTTCIRVLYDV